MWTVFIFLHLWALHFTVSSPLPSPINVTFSSINLRNTLQWFPGDGMPSDTHFTVQYVIYGDSVINSKGRRPHWRAVRLCTKILRSWCDLSNETWDLEESYYARVRAVSKGAASKWTLTQRFDPKSGTIFGPPLVSVEIENNSAIITLKGPMRYQSNNHTPMVSMATFYPQMRYNLSVNNTRRGQMSHFPAITSPYKFPLMDYDTQYCFSAKTKFPIMPVQCQSSAWHCITTPPDPVIAQLKRVVVGIVVPSACICVLVVVVYLLYHYLSGKGQKSPYILSPPSFNPPPLTFPPENPNFIFITVVKPDIDRGVPDAACLQQQQHIAGPPPGYAPQGSETPPVPAEPWHDAPIDYGFVAAAPISVREDEERERGHDSSGDVNILKGEHQKGASRHSYDTKWRVQDDGLYASQAKSFISQRSTHTWSQTHLPKHIQMEVSTLTKAQPSSLINSVPLTQTQEPLLSFQGGVDREDEREDRDSPGLFIHKTPETGLFHIPLCPQTRKEGGMEEDTDRNVRVEADGKIDGGMEEESTSEGVPLLSAYASQNCKIMSTSDFLPDDYGVLSKGTVDEIERDEEQKDEGTTFIDWDPRMRKLVLPEMATEFSTVGKMDGLIQEEQGMMEEVNALKGQLTLADVYVRQQSEEKPEAQMELEKGEEVDYILTKWDLVITMDP